MSNLVENYDIINTSIEDKLVETENIYKIKKDLKRLKFISELPNVLENQLNEYISAKEAKTVKSLEKSLIYYEKCKDFLNLHKDNVINYNLPLVISKGYIYKDQQPYF